MRIWVGDALHHCRHRVALFLRLHTMALRVHLSSRPAQSVRGFRFRAESP
jgi:hypothetical protein